MIIEVKRRTHVQRMTYDDFERRIRDGEIPPETLIRFDVVTGDAFKPAGELELYRELMAPDRLAFRLGLSRRGVPIVTAILVGFQLRVWFWSHSPDRGRFLVDTFTNAGPAILERGEVWRLITYGLLHLGFTHLLFNLCFLAYTGYHLERAAGRRNLVLIYFFSVVLGGCLSMLLTPLPPSMGASGGVFGLIAATVVLGWKHWDDIPDRARRYFGWALLPYLVVSGVSGMVSEDVDNWSHLGGLLGGALLMTVLEPEALSARRGANRTWRSIAMALLLATFVGVHQAGTRLVPLVPDKDELGFVVSRPAYWQRGWLFTGDRAWQSVDFRARIGAATTTHQRPIGVEEAAERLVERIRSGSQELEVLSQEKVDVDGVPAIRIRMRFLFSDAPQVADAVVVTRGVYEHRVMMKVIEGAQDRYAPLIERIFDSFDLLAVDELRTAERRARQHPRSWEPALNLARARYRTGDSAGALASYDRVLELSPDEPQALVGRVETVHHYGLPQGAGEARSALGTAGDNPRVVVAAVDLLVDLGHQDEAVEALDAAWALLPGDRRLRRARQRLGLTVEAPPPLLTP